jgi:hypothetical protein
VPDRCPDCLCAAKVIRSSLCSNGSRRRRYECQSCATRWTTHEGDPPGHRGGLPVGFRINAPCLHAEEVRLILTAKGSISQIARQIGRSRPAVSAVLGGKTHSRLFPELPRRTSLSCFNCIQWSGRCRLGFPDPEEDGPQAAAWCIRYAANSDSP